MKLFLNIKVMIKNILKKESKIFIGFDFSEI
jgi:hypothetical protein